MAATCRCLCDKGCCMPMPVWHGLLHANACVTWAAACWCLCDISCCMLVPVWHGLLHAGACVTWAASCWCLCDMSCCPVWHGLLHAGAHVWHGLLCIPHLQYKVRRSNALAAHLFIFIATLLTNVLSHPRYQFSCVDVYMCTAGFLFPASSTHIKHQQKAVEPIN
jgi:hypothetical protein